MPKNLAPDFTEPLESMVGNPSCLKYGVTLANSVGIIDQDFNSEICALLYNMTDHLVTIPAGTKLCQLVFLPTCKVGFDEKKVESTDTHLGFGSTDKK